jgi:hypothetical protein
MSEIKPKAVIGFYINKHFCLCNRESLNKNPQSGKEILRWMAGFGTSLNVLWNLDYSFSCIASKLSLTVEQLQSLLNTTKLQIDDLLITYIPSKFMSVKAGTVWESPYAMFSDASQYMDSCPYKIDEDEGYALQQAKYAENIGTQVRDSLYLLKVDAQNLISPINQFAKTYFKKMGFPTVDILNAVDPEIGEYAYLSLESGWFSCMRKGMFEEVWDYDLNAAYGFSLSKMPDLREGSWKLVHEYSDAPIGFYKTRVTITAPFSPIGFKAKDYNFTPMGTWEKYLTQQQIDCIYKWKLGKVEVIDGYIWTDTKGYKPIYAPLIKRLHEIKEESEGIRRDVIKRTINGLWGVQGAVINGKFGEYFQPVIHACVEINTRLRVFDLCMNNGIVPIAIMLDGVVTDKQLENIDLGIEMGQWKLSHHGQCIAINSDVVAIEGKDSGKDFAVTLDFLSDEIHKNPNASRYTMTKLSPITVGKVVQNPNLLGQLGEILPQERSVDLTIEFKRNFPDIPKTGAELISGKHYNSMSPDISLIDINVLPDIDDTLLTSVG